MDIQIFDLVEVQDSLAMSGVKIEKIVDITRDYFVTRDHRYSKSSLHCLTKGRESFKIIGVQPNVKRKIYGYCNAKGFETLALDKEIYVSELRKGDTVIEIAYYPTSQRLNVEVNSIRVFIGVIKNIDTFKIIYESVTHGIK